MIHNHHSTPEGILFTDAYQLTMAHLYFRMGLHERTAQFDHFFRSYPDYGTHKAGYCVNAGLGTLTDWMQDVHFTDTDIEHLRGQTGSTGKRLYEDDFLAWLKTDGNFQGINLQAIPEGRVIHPGTPICTVTGSLAKAQLLETALLNKLNFQILIATKAARIRQAGRQKVTLEFGMRRAHGTGAIEGTRAALIGGADFSSNAGASYALGFEPKGTHAHSMVQAFMALGEGELAAFQAYADVYPDDCLLLVDTVNTLESGVPNAIKVFDKLKRKGHKPIGIRLDSGDLAYLSIQCAKMLDAAGFEDTSIVLSNSLDELTLWQILTQIEEDAPHYDMDADHIVNRLVYGVGTQLITSKGSPSLGGVYKLVSMHDSAGTWQPAIKISENPIKIPNPGQKKVWRVYDTRNRAIADLVGLSDETPGSDDPLVLRHPASASKIQRIIPENIAKIEPLQQEIFREGELVYESPTIPQM
ncbi:MAG: nicotinate phosphoribosyltransferase, partial [Aggregatilineales bacterium]